MKLILAMLVVTGLVFGVVLYKVQAELQRLSDAMNDRAIISEILGDIDQ
jgi:hypothetical protein